MNIAIVQARMGSSRLPGKVMMKLNGIPVLQHVVNRVNASKEIDKVIVATTNALIDKEIVDFCGEYKIPCFEGSENDVLDRFYQATRSFNLIESDVVVRITSDCPLIDPNIIDEVIRLLQDSDAGYASNTHPPTYPDGLDVEAFKFICLEKAWKEAVLPSEREHVTPFIKNHPEYFKIANLTYGEDISHLRWTLDEPDDFTVIRYIYENLYFDNSIFYMKDILQLINKDRAIFDTNSQFARNEGYIKSLENDRHFIKDEK